jgi:type IV secretory pathway TraG/TraD family ATPase VirD4
MPQTKANFSGEEKLLFGGIAAVVVGGSLLAAGAELAALVSGASFLHFTPVLGFQAIAHHANEHPLWHGKAPSGVLVIACDAVLLLAAAFLAWFAYHHLWHHAKRLASGDFTPRATSRTNRKRDAESLGCDPAESPGVLLGDEDYGRYDEPLFVLGQPGSGKTVWIVRNVLHTPGPSIVTSTKPELVFLTAGWHVEQGRPVWVWDLGGTLILDADLRLRWDPIASINSERDARVMGRRFAYASGLGGSNDAHWVEAGTGVLEWLFWAAHLERQRSHVTMADVRRWALIAGQIEGPAGLLETAGFRAGAAELRRALGEEAAATGGGYTASISGTITTALAGFSEPALLDACSPASHESFDVRRFVEERGIIYVVGSPEAQRSAAGVVAAMIEDTLEKARALRLPQRPPLALWLDEAPNIARLPSLPEIVTTGRGEGILPVIIGQTLAKFAESFGREGADTIRQACPVELAYGGQKDIEYLRSLEAISGETTVDSWSESYGQDGAGSRTKSERVKARYSIEELRALPPHNAWLVDRHRALRPVKTTPWWAYKDGERVARSVAWAEAHGFTRPSDIPSMGKYEKALATWRETYAAMPWRACSADSGPLVSAHAIQGEETHDEW